MIVAQVITDVLQKQQLSVQGTYMIENNNIRIQNIMNITLRKMT